MLFPVMEVLLKYELHSKHGKIFDSHSPWLLEHPDDGRCHFLGQSGLTFLVVSFYLTIFKTKYAILYLPVVD